MKQQQKQNRKRDKVKKKGTQQTRAPNTQLTIIYRPSFFPPKESFT
jgi:hypothetical protein